jgi:hypothetical protein
MLAQEIQSGDTLTGYGQLPDAYGIGRVVESVTRRGKSVHLTFTDGTTDVLPTYALVYLAGETYVTP